MKHEVSSKGTHHILPVILQEVDLPVMASANHKRERRHELAFVRSELPSQAGPPTVPGCLEYRPLHHRITDLQLHFDLDGDGNGISFHG